MKRGIWLACAVLVLTLAAVLAGCGGQTGQPTSATTGQLTTAPTIATFSAAPPGISTRDAYEMVQKNAGNPDFVILDVRTPEEFATGHLAGAINLDYEADTFAQEIGKLDNKKVYLLYCKAGSRSSAADMMMKDLGFKGLFWITGGIVQWQADGYPIAD